MITATALCEKLPFARVDAPKALELPEVERQARGFYILTAFLGFTMACLSVLSVGMLVWVLMCVGPWR